MDSSGDDDGADDTIITCWCGVSGTSDELFDDALYADGCGGTRHLDCYCGGDQCVCHHHGQAVECPGCEDCSGLQDDEYYEYELGDES